MAKKIANASAPETQPALNKHEDFILKYKNLLIGAVVALIVIVAGIIIYNNYKASKLEQAQTAMQVPELAMQMAMSSFSEKDFAVALNGDSTGTKGFLQIADEYSSTKAGNLANLYAGLCYAQMEKWQEAISFIEKFDAKDDQMISPAALGALGNAYAHVDQLDKAVETLKKAAEKADNNSLSPTFLVQAGEILESQGKKEEALKLYQTVKDKYFNSMSYQTIDAYIERASAK